jgi:hypothetical protein
LLVVALAFHGDRLFTRKSPVWRVEVDARRARHEEGEREKTDGRGGGKLKGGFGSMKTAGAAKRQAARDEGFPQHAASHGL